MKSGEWKTPLGGVKINEKISEELMGKCNLLKNNSVSHQSEHSVEVQLPFLQYRFGGDFTFVPIVIGGYQPTYDFLEECRVLGETVANVIEKQKDEWIIIASSDLSHYVPYEYAYQVDKWVIESIVKMDEEEYFDRVQEKNVSTCGIGGVASAVIAAKKLGAEKGKLFKYATSGDSIDDKSSVVGYGSVILS